MRVRGGVLVLALIVSTLGFSKVPAIHAGTLPIETEAGGGVRQGALATWEIIDGSKGTLFYVLVLRVTGTYGAVSRAHVSTGTSTGTALYAGRARCDVVSGKLKRCEDIPMRPLLLDDDEFIIDPLLRNARLKATRGSSSFHIRWEAAGEYSSFPLFAHKEQYGTLWADVFGTGGIAILRDATASGRVFDRRLGRAHIAALASSAGKSVSLCIVAKAPSWPC